MTKIGPGIWRLPHTRIILVKVRRNEWRAYGSGAHILPHEPTRAAMLAAILTKIEEIQCSQ